MLTADCITLRVKGASWLFFWLNVLK